jgi:hypothetical protein
MSHQEIREVEGARLIVCQCGEHLRAREEFVAVRPWQTLHAVCLEHTVEFPTRAAVCVGHEDPREAPAVLADGLIHRRRDALGAVVQGGIEATQGHVRERACAAQRFELARDGAAGEHQRAVFGAGFAHAPALRRSRKSGSEQGGARRRRATMMCFREEIRPKS